MWELNREKKKEPGRIIGRIISTSLGSAYYVIVELDSIRNSGGIIVLWDKRDRKGEYVDSGESNTYL